MGGLFSKPKVQAAPPPPPTPVEIKAPVVNTEQVDRSAADIMRRRRGTQATVTGASNLGTTAGSVAATSLLGG
jgi:type IV secretory pathway VirB10-like protein